MSGNLTEIRYAIVSQVNDYRGLDDRLQGEYLDW